MKGAERRLIAEKDDVKNSGRSEVRFLVACNVYIRIYTLICALRMTSRGICIVI